MAIAQRKNGRFVIVFTLFVALVLMVMPQPLWWRPYNPPWVMMVVIFWCLAIPDRIGIGVAWIVGLFIDAFPGSTFLGVNALTFAVTAYITLSLYQRIRVSPLIQQALTVFCLLLLYQFLIRWFDGFGDVIRKPFSIEFFYPPLVGFIVWPALYFVLQGLTQRYKIS